MTPYPLTYSHADWSQTSSHLQRGAYNLSLLGKKGDVLNNILWERAGEKMAVLTNRVHVHKQLESPWAGALLTTTLCVSTVSVTEYSGVELTKHVSNEAFMLSIGGG